MNQKIPFPKLSTRIAELCNISQTEAEEFGKVFFDIITETLCSGESVKIKGVGTFSPTDDVAHPVEFTPDSTLAETINAPFAMFEPEALSESISVDEIESITSPTDEPDFTQPTEELHTEPTEISNSIVEEALIEASKVETIENTQVETAPVETTQDENPTASGIEINANSANVESEMVETKEETENKVEMSVSASEGATEGQSQVQSQDKVESTAVNVSSGVNDVPVQVPQPSTTVSIPSVTEDEDEEEYVIESNDNKRNGLGFGWGFVIGLLVGLALGACAVFLAIDYIYPTHDDISALLEGPNAVDETGMVTEPAEEISPIVPDTNIVTLTDSAKATTETTAEPQTAQAEEVTSTQTATTQAEQPVIDTIRPGYLLNDMAKKHYGNKCFWVYIYKENQDKIKNPNRVSPGMKLVIPSPSKYGINAKDQSSIKEANALAGKILEKYPR